MWTVGLEHQLENVSFFSWPSRMERFSEQSSSNQLAKWSELAEILDTGLGLALNIFVVLRGLSSDEPTCGSPYHVRKGVLNREAPVCRLLTWTDQ